MEVHDLSGKRETDAAAFRLGGEERDEDLLLAVFADHGAVVGETDMGLFVAVYAGGDGDFSCASLQSVLNQIDEYLGNLAFIEIKEDIGG